jgi:hypothetical protein
MVAKADVLGYIVGRGEDEIVVLPENVRPFGHGEGTDPA